jgi:hypothetical protein
MPTADEARARVRRAVRNGVLVKPDACERCGRDASESRPYGLHGHHHNGYDEPHVLDVQWVCASCHAHIHGNACLTPEERLELSRRAALAYRARFAPEERSEVARRARAHLTNERLSEIARLGNAAYLRKVSPERRSEIARSAGLKGGAKGTAAWLARTTPEERSASRRRGWETRRARERAVT